MCPSRFVVPVPDPQIFNLLVLAYGLRPGPRVLLLWAGLRHMSSRSGSQTGSAGEFERVLETIDSRREEVSSKLLESH